MQLGAAILQLSPYFQASLMAMVFMHIPTIWIAHLETPQFLPSAFLLFAREGNCFNGFRMKRWTICSLPRTGPVVIVIEMGRVMNLIYPVQQKLPGKFGFSLTGETNTGKTSGRGNMLCNEYRVQYRQWQTEVSRSWRTFLSWNLGWREISFGQHFEVNSYGLFFGFLIVQIQIHFSQLNKCTKMHIS